MSVNGRFDGITRGDLLKLAAENNIKDASEIIDCIYETAHRWPQMAYDSGVPSDIVNMIVKNSYETFDNND